MNQLQEIKINLLKQLIQVIRLKDGKGFKLSLSDLSNKSNEVLNINWVAKLVDWSEEQKIIYGIINHLVPVSNTGYVKEKAFPTEADLFLSCIEYLDSNDKDNILFNTLALKFQEQLYDYYKEEVKKDLIEINALEEISWKTETENLYDIKLEILKNMPAQTTFNKLKAMNFPIDQERIAKIAIEVFNELEISNK